MQAAVIVCPVLPMRGFALSFADIETGHRRFSGVVRHTPVPTSRTVDKLSGARLLFKREKLPVHGCVQIP